MSPGVFHFFKILISGFLVVKRAKNGPKWQRIFPSCSISQEPHIIWLSFMVHMCKMIISLVVFFNFLKFPIAELSRGWRGKNDSKWQNVLSGAPYISGTISYDLHLWYTCMYKRITSSGIPFIFSKFWLPGSKGKKKKNGPKWQKNLSSHSVSQELYIKWLWFFMHMYKMMISPAFFFVFSCSKFWFFGFLEG